MERVAWRSTISNVLDSLLHIGLESRGSRSEHPPRFGIDGVGLTVENTPDSGGQFFASGWKQLLFVAAVALAITTAIELRTVPLDENHPEYSNPWDHHKYIWMATHDPFGFHVAPFCWRVATPALAKALPFGVEKNFSIIAFLSLWITGIAVFYLARKLRFPKWTAFSAVWVFFAFDFVVRANLYNIWKPDPLAYLFVVLALISIVDKKDWRFAVLIAVGVSVKESVLFVVPLYYTLNAKRLLDWRLASRTLALALPGVAVFVALRALIPMRNDEAAYIESLPQALRQVQLGISAYAPGLLWNEIGLNRIREFSPSSAREYTIGTFGLTAVALPFFAARRNVSLFVKFLPFLILVYAQLMFATNTSRLLALGFPAVLIMALNGAEAIARWSRLGVAAFSLFFAALIALSLVRPWPFVIPPLYQLLAFLMFLAACVLYRFTRRTNS
jgi:hypothetical protein